ncbi:hypothetical protein PIB30_061553 [Stylosanthes scabra]|uniref:Uncharacterized protein n=1 Tax=Stylosanthes scabra TaxID=79078 RepID=A0ABU6TKQ3_9FABA|nr:hypothetical protein [Stylosanthes scabra]
MCEGDETKVEETHGLDGVKSEGSKGKELVEEEDPDESQPMDMSVESGFLKFLMGDMKPIYSSFSSRPKIESQGSNPSSGYPTIVLAFKVATYPEHGLLLMLRVISLPH